jgi:hypothetical protein
LFVYAYMVIIDGRLFLAKRKRESAQNWHVAKIARAEIASVAARPQGFVTYILDC